MNVTTKKIRDIEALWMLKVLRIEELPTWAESILSSGCDNEDIVQLAICSPNEIENIMMLFSKILKSEGGGSMSEIEALRRYAKLISAAILENEISPDKGAHLLWDATITAKQKNFHELDPFIYAASEMDSRPMDRDFFEKAILQEAKKWAEIGD